MLRYIQIFSGGFRNFCAIEMTKIDDRKYENFVKMGDFVLKFENADDVDAADLQNAAVELRENAEIRRNSLRELKQLIAGWSRLIVKF